MIVMIDLRLKRRNKQNEYCLLYTSMCDAISDAILDALLEQDPMSRVACETATTTGLVLVMGEITTSAYVDIQKIVRETVREIGYDRAKYGFDCDTCGVITAIDEQSKDCLLYTSRCV